MFKNSLRLIWGPAGPGGGWDSQVSVKWNAVMKKTRLLLCSSCVLYCISPIVSLCISVGISASRFRLFSVSSVIRTSWRPVAYCGTSLIVLTLFLHIGGDLKLQLPFRAVTLFVLCTLWCSHCEGHLLSPSGPREYLTVLILHIQRSIQQPFILERSVPLPLCKRKWCRAQKVIWHILSIALKSIFRAVKAGKIKEKIKKRNRKYCFQIEVK